MRSKASRNCRRKVRYRSENHARIVGANTDGDKWPYVCEICGNWHLTKRPQSGPPTRLNDSGIFK